MDVRYIGSLRLNIMTTACKLEKAPGSISRREGDYSPREHANNRLSLRVALGDTGLRCKAAKRHCPDSDEDGHIVAFSEGWRVN